MNAPRRKSGTRRLYTPRAAPGEELCCPHRGADHETNRNIGSAKPGGKCTVPDCTCQGWKPRTRQQRGKREA